MRIRRAPYFIEHFLASRTSHRNRIHAGFYLCGYRLMQILNGISDNGLSWGDKRGGGLFAAE